MKKLFASASYTFNNFYNNLNIQGQMVFSVIVILLVILSVLLLITYIVQGIKNKKRLNELKNNTEKIIEAKNKTKIEKEEREPLYFNEKTEIEDIAKRVEDALKEETPITLTNFEEDQERTAIISIDELMTKAKELELIDDEEKGTVNYLEKYNLESAEVNEVINNTMNDEKPKEVKAFKVSQVISPIYGIKKEAVDSNNN